MEVYRKALELLEAGKPAALGIVLRTLGSTPQKAGAKALFEPTGKVHGTLGGGCLEAEAQHRALLALDHGAAAEFTVNLDEVDGWDDGLICGGRATIFTSPLIAANRMPYLEALEAGRDNLAGTLATVLVHPAYPAGTAIWLPEGAPAPAGLHAGDLRAAAQSGKAVLVCDGKEIAQSTAAFFLEPVCPAPKLVVVGAGHIGKALSHYAARVGFRVTVVDDRPGFANRENLPDAHEVRCGDIEAVLGELPLSPRDFVVIVTRGHRHDGVALAACIHRELAYLGLIGSKRKGLLLRKRLLEEGLASEAEIERVISPIGFDLGGTSVEEIALSIAAQLVSVRRRQDIDTRALAYQRPVRGEELPIA